MSVFLLSSTPYTQACDPTARYAYNYLNEVKVHRAACAMGDFT